MNISKQDKQRVDYVMFLLGIATSVVVGVILYNDGYGFGVSAAVGYGLILLIDIRKEVSKHF